MVACLEELGAAFEHVEQPECFEVQASTEHIVNEMGEADLIVGKHRGGPMSTVTVAFQGHFARFVDMAADA